MRWLIFLLNIAAICLLPGCRSEFVKKISKAPDSQALEKSGVSVGVVELNHTEAKGTFGTDPKVYGYTVLLLTVANRTAHPLSIYPSYINLHRSSGKALSREYHYDTYQWAIAGGVFAAVFWWPAIPFVIVPMALGMRSHNKKITRDIRLRTLGPRDILHIGPYESIHRFIIIPAQSVWRGAELSVLDETTGELIRFIV